MKSDFKQRIAPYFAAIVFALLLFAAVVFAGVYYGGRSAHADENTANVGETYYRDELKNSELAQKFYAVMEKMYKDGSFKSGVAECDLISEGVVTEDQVDKYLDGDKKIPVALGAARDAFYMDNPDLFYIDVYKLYLSAGTRGGKTVAYLGTGNADNYYLEGAYKNAADVDKAIAEYDAAVAAVVAEVNKESDIVGKIKAANKYIAENTAYAYGDRDGFAGTAYGALVSKYALCGGYARAFKVIMDEVGIPCVLIQGFAYSGKTVDGLQAGMESHMWNAVEINGLWYGVDVTYNSSCGNINKYTLVGDDFLSVNHFSDGVISSSGFELKYPALRPLNYGVKEDANGFIFEDERLIGDTQFGYDSFTSGDETGKSLKLGISYEGKNGLELLEEGKYLAYRMSAEKDVWTDWACMALFYKENYEDDAWTEGMYTVDLINTSVNQVQYAIIDHAPDGMFYKYNPDTLTSESIIAISTVYTNEGYGSYIPSPYVKHMTPNTTGMIKSFEPIAVTMEYSEKLVKIDDSKDVGLSIVGSNRSDLQEHCKIDDFVWDAENNKVSFVLTPSKYYAHNCVVYNMTPTNLVGEKSGKVPDAGQITFKMKSVVCPKVFNDGRLYMQVYGEPQFVGAEDMSLDGFRDKDGKPVSGRQRSQLMLVVNEPDAEETKQMNDALTAATDLEAGDIKKSATYQIDLHVCGIVQKVPKGSYMQVGFGFPEGFKYNTPGVTFTVYHYTLKADGTIDEVQPVPCVITEYGILATVDSFSPFMVCAIDSAKAPKDKYVYSSVVGGKGGTIDKTTVSTVAEGGSVSYTLTADDGYDFQKITLNGIDMTAKTVGTGATRTLTLAYADLDGQGEGALANSNVLEVSYVSDRVSEYRDEQGIQIVQPKNMIVTADDMIDAVAHESGAAVTPVEPSAPKSHVGAIVGGVIAAVVVIVAGAAVAVYFLKKNKKETAGAGAGKSASASKNESASKNTAANKNTSAGRNTTANRSANTNTTANAGRDANANRNVSANRPANTNRPASADRPTSTNRPVSSNRPADADRSRVNPNVGRPTSANRPASTNRPTSANRPADASKNNNNDKRK